MDVKNIPLLMYLEVTALGIDLASFISASVPPRKPNMTVLPQLLCQTPCKSEKDKIPHGQALDIGRSVIN